jgi:hypothetical protein
VDSRLDHDRPPIAQWLAVANELGIRLVTATSSQSRYQLLRE